MTCRNICEKYIAVKPTEIGRYLEGQRRCQVCERYITWEGLWCPCCSYRLRTKPRNKKYKAKFRENQQIEKQNPNAKKGDKLDAFIDEDGIMIRVGEATLVEMISDHGKYNLWQVILNGQTCTKFILA